MMNRQEARNPPPKRPTRAERALARIVDTFDSLEEDGR